MHRCQPSLWHGSKQSYGAFIHIESRAFLRLPHSAERGRLPSAAVHGTAALGPPAGLPGHSVDAKHRQLSLNLPYAMTVDTSGNIYIADALNNRVVKVTPQGNASVLSISISGTGLSRPQGITVDASGNLYIADTFNNRVVEVSPSGSGSIVSTGSVTLSNPSGVAVDPSGNIFIADTYNNRIVEAPSGGVAVALAITVSSGLANLTQPVGLAVDTSGNLYIVDSGRIVFVANAAGGGTAGSVLSISGLLLIQPSGVAVDSSGNIFITDSPSKRIVIVDTNGNGSAFEYRFPDAQLASGDRIGHFRKCLYRG